MAEMGVTVFMPHTINKDMMKRLTEYGDMFQLTAKDKKLVTMAEKHLEWINFEIENPLPDFFLRELYEKEVYMVAWKIPDTELRPVEEILHDFSDYLSKPQPIPNDLSDPPISMPPILKPYPVMVDDEELERFKGQEVEGDAFIRERIESLMIHREAAGIQEEFEEPVQIVETVAAELPPVEELAEEEEVEEEQERDEGIVMEDDKIEAVVNSDNDDDDDDDDAKQRTTGPVRFKVEDAEEEAEVEEEQEPEIDLRTNKVFMLPVWTPYNKVAQAALIYLYFRNVSQNNITITSSTHIRTTLSKPIISSALIPFLTRRTLPLCSTLISATN